MVTSEVRLDFVFGGICPTNIRLAGDARLISIRESRGEMGEGHVAICLHNQMKHGETLFLQTKELQLVNFQSLCTLQVRLFRLWWR